MVLSLRGHRDQWLGAIPVPWGSFGHWEGEKPPNGAAGLQSVLSEDGKGGVVVVSGSVPAD